MKILFQDEFVIKTIQEDPEWTSKPCIGDIDMYTSPKGYDCYMEIKIDDYPVYIQEKLEIILIRPSSKSIDYWCQYDREPPLSSLLCANKEEEEFEKTSLLKFKKLYEHFEYVCQGMVYEDICNHNDELSSQEFQNDEKKNPSIKISFGGMLMKINDTTKKGRLKNIAFNGEFLYCMVRKIK